MLPSVPSMEEPAPILTQRELFVDQLAGYGWQHAIGVMKEERVLQQLQTNPKRMVDVFFKIE